ncbi:HEAT repeat domain-containing protein [Myxococcota bacterium]|nr:HEAT repeat domain-containing protein [Myxococcota bacterium]MBU1511296.1 HEAT repeat domain-containing protein [Myxococcota bacterium]
MCAWFQPACRTGREGPVDPAPTIVRIEVQQMPFAGAPTFSAGENLFVDRLRTAGSETGTKVAIGRSIHRYARPLGLNVNWSLRPAARIRPVTEGDHMLDHAIELTVQSTLTPLFPHAPGDVHTAVAGRWIQYAQADVKSFDERLLAELGDAFLETLTLLWMDAELQDMAPLQVLRLLSSENAHQKRAAVEAVKKRRLLVAVPALIRMLDSDESLSLRMTVAGVLAQLGDPAAVEPLAEFALLVTPEQTVYLCSEIARIGGDDARRFLYWISTSHRHPDVRKAASNLLRSMLQELPLH